MVWLRIRRWVVRPFFWSLAAGAFVLLCLHAFLASGFVRERHAGRSACTGAASPSVIGTATSQT